MPAAAGDPARVVTIHGSNGGVLDVLGDEHDDNADGEKVGVYHYNDGDNQLWSVRRSLDGRLKLAGWVGSSGGVTVALVVLAHARLEIELAADRAATVVALLAAGRTCRVDHDPPPGTLEFSRHEPGARARPRGAQPPVRGDAVGHPADLSASPP